ncbi:homocysteine biosynthesis protein [Candidatus Oleimmundimicrobium sp.]|uniref:homocysteine biosynthesis protein n=1 Tax=Candidatus Oleimmundimicrobium sp. TaxID=3060597 RepID=UPI00271FCEAC|nr:homocysteine biosynthesis protein [Candidatus Oleimmundimicrobium sp.]MDO8886495.1 homocysteine biosynthesis protein [Candidatus Oleimmundimicrobium sp.]
MAKSFDEINEKIKKGQAVVVTAEEIIDIVKEKGVKQTAKEVDVVTTATFSPMCSSGAFLNFGHSDPPINIKKVWLNDVPAYAGMAAIDAYIGATEVSESEGLRYGGAHVIEDLIAGKAVKLQAVGRVTDCYPRSEIETFITKDTINQAYLFNPRNVYQNYAVAVNSTERTIYTYMGTLLPKLGNATYATSGQLSPLLNDPHYRTIGIGTRIFLCGAQGYVAWEGTQHSPSQERTDKGIPVSGAATIALIGNLKDMSRDYIRAATFHNYGVSIFIGVGIPIPILDEEMVEFVSVSDKDIYAEIVDYSVPKRNKPVLGRITYAELRKGKITLRGREVPAASISSYAKAREIAGVLKSWIQKGDFLLTEPVQKLPEKGTTKPLDIQTKEEL